MAKPRMPAKLGARAKRLWTEVTSTYELRSDEYAILEDACREVDLIDRLQKAIEGSDLLVSGSMGQPVANPLVQEIRQHRSTLARILGGLKLPDEPGQQQGASTSTSARAAAVARWSRGA